MVGKSINLSSKNISQGLVSKSLARNLKVCGNKGASRWSDGNLEEDLSDISDAEVAVHLNCKKEIIMKKIVWEMMNPEYEKGKPRKPTTGKKKDPIKKTAFSKQTSTTRIESNAESENNKRPSVEINYNVLDELFDAENSPKRAKLEKPIVVSDQVEHSEQTSEKSRLKPQESEEEEEDEEEELDWNSKENAYEGIEEFNGDADLEFENQDEEEDNDGIIW